MKYGEPSGRYEHCRLCTSILEVDESGRLPEHSRGYEPTPCRGGCSLSREERARRATARANERDDRAIAVRDDAAVALDAFESGRADLQDLIPEFKRLALHAYARRFELKVRPLELWRWESPGAPPTPASKGDVYCRFCGELLLRRVTRISLKAAGALPEAHLTRCMLWFLAGMREAVSPETKVLPPEHRPDDSG